MPIDLGQAVVVNESGNPDQPGDVTLFETIVDAEGWIEPIDVENGEYFAYLGDGRELSLAVIDGRVHIGPAPGSKDHRKKIRYFLEHYAKAVLKARKYRGTLKSEPDLATMSIAELIGFIGFSR